VVTKSWFFDAVLYVYALSLLFTFSDFAERNPRAKRMGTGLLAFVWFMQTIFFVNHMIQSGKLNLSSIFDSLFFFSWLLVTLSLILSILLRIDFLPFFVNLIGFIVAAIALFSSETISPLAERWQVRDELLFIHVSLAIGSYAAFFFSALFSGMLLFVHTRLKKKLWSATMRRMPSLDRIQRYAIRAVVIGIPLLLLSLVLGIVWISLEKEWSLLMDAKVLSSILVVMMYSVYLWKQIARKSTWVRMAVLNLAACIIVLLSYITSNWLSNFH
jgi:HemX protein